MSHDQSFFRTLTNIHGFEVTFCSFGATISSFKIPVNEDKLDIVLGFDNVEDYQRSFDLHAKPFLGAVVGPHAGRLKMGRYTDNGKEVQLDKNFEGHHLHGGTFNLSNQFWELTSISDNRVVFEFSVNNGQTKFKTEYFLSSETLYVTLSAVTDIDMLINLTQHSYFNLAGHKKDITNLEMKIEALEILEIDTDLIPTGKFLPTKNTCFDFSEFCDCPSEIDTSFILNGKHPAAILRNKENGLVLKVFTNQPTVHVYIGGSTGSIQGKENAKYHNKSGICFEAQNFPDSPNHSNFKNGILRKGEQYINEIAYQFKTSNSL